MILVMGTTVEMLQAHLRGEHREKARNDCNACKAAGGSTEPRSTPKGPKTPRERRPCQCECGALASPGARFLPGHDAKLKSRLRRETGSSDEQVRANALAKLTRLGW